MKIAFLHHEGRFMTELSRRLAGELRGHDVVNWKAGESAPSDDFDVVLVAGALGAKELAGQPKLAFVQTTTAGYENVDVDAASQAGIWTAYAPADETNNAISVAEQAVFLMIGASRNVNVAFASFRDRSIVSERIGTALFGKTACILGLGGIGRAIADRLRGFGMKIIATDPHPGGAPADIEVFAPDRMADAVASADYVIVCVPATKENEHLVDAALLARMKAGAIVINIARGSLVDERALLQAIESKHIAAAGLDVLAHEPPNPEDPLLALPQVLVTPHIAGATDVMLEGTLAFIAAQVAAFDAGRKPKALLAEPASPRRPLAG